MYVWLPGDTRVYLDVMLSSCGLENDLVLTERENGNKDEWERGEGRVGLQLEDQQIHWFDFRQTQKAH